MFDERRNCSMLAIASLNSDLSTSEGKAGIADDIEDAAILSRRDGPPGEGGGDCKWDCCDETEKDKGEGCRGIGNTGGELDKCECAMFEAHNDTLK